MAKKPSTTIFSGNSTRAWVSSLLIIVFALVMFLIDLAQNAWVFELNFNVLEIIIVFIVIMYWRTKITINSKHILVRQFRHTEIPLTCISSLSIIHNPLLGYVAAIEWKEEGKRRPRKTSFFASFYKKGQTELFLKKLQKVMPKEVQVNLSRSYTKKRAS